jgi:hypothetical protein
MLNYNTAYEDTLVTKSFLGIQVLGSKAFTVPLFHAHFLYQQNLLSTKFQFSYFYVCISGHKTLISKETVLILLSKGK